MHVGKVHFGEVHVGEVHLSEVRVGEVQSGMPYPSTPSGAARPGADLSCLRQYPAPGLGTDFSKKFNKNCEKNAPSKDVKNICCEIAAIGIAKENF